MVFRSKIKEMWEEIYKNQTNICLFLSSNEDPSPEIKKLLLISLRLVIGELYLYKEIYEKYPVTNYTTEDYINILIDHMSRETSIESIRENIWGHIKFYFPDILRLFQKIATKSEEINDNDNVLLIKCLTVIYAESVVLKREQQLKNDKKGSIKN